MRSLPDAATLAELVSNVTSTMCGTTFQPADDGGRGESICGRMFLLPIQGERDINVVLSCDNVGGETLAAALRGCPRDQLTKAMVTDGIAELLNMVAGQIQRDLEIDQPLGLPRPTTLAEMVQGAGVGFNDSILLSSQGLCDLKLWVFEKTALPAETSRSRQAAGKFRSLFRKFVAHG